MSQKAILGIGWDVGGWMGKKQGVAVARWQAGGTGIEWMRTPRPFQLPVGDPISPAGLLGHAGLDAGLLDEHEVVIAIDAPLGFPFAFAEFLAEWPFGDGGSAGRAGRPEREIDNRLAYRATDRHICKTFEVVRDGVRAFGLAYGSLPVSPLRSEAVGAPQGRWRDKIVIGPQRRRKAGCAEGSAEEKQRRLSWAQLLKRVFVRILDFGLAKFVAERTDTSMAMGTPMYMAPEQVTRRHIGPWTVAPTIDTARRAPSGGGSARPWRPSPPKQPRPWARRCCRASWIRVM